MYSMATPARPTPHTASEDKVPLKHFTWGFVKNAAICLNRESYNLRKNIHTCAHTKRHTHTHSSSHVVHTYTHLAHQYTIPAGSSSMLSEVLGIWRLPSVGNSSLVLDSGDFRLLFGRLPRGYSTVCSWRSVAFTEPRFWNLLFFSGGFLWTGVPSVCRFWPHRCQRQSAQRVPIPRTSVIVG